MVKTLYLIRGLPGSGKTTLARIIAHDNFAADDYFETPDGYKFNPKDLGVAHKHCQDNVKNSMILGIDKIAVHNTFSQQWEADPYIAMAYAFGYTINVIECQNSFANTHNVPDQSIRAMRERWEEINVEKLV